MRVCVRVRVYGATKQRWSSKVFHVILCWNVLLHQMDNYTWKIDLELEVRPRGRARLRPMGICAANGRKRELQLQLRQAWRARMLGDFDYRMKKRAWKHGEL